MRRYPLCFCGWSLYSTFELFDQTISSLSPKTPCTSSRFRTIIRLLLVSGSFWLQPSELFTVPAKGACARAAGMKCVMCCGVWGVECMNAVYTKVISWCTRNTVRPANFQPAVRCDHSFESPRIASSPTLRSPCLQISVRSFRCLFFVFMGTILLFTFGANNEYYR